MITAMGTSNSLDEFFAAALGQASADTALAQNAAYRHLRRLIEANLNQITALDSLGRAVARAGFDLQSAGTQLSRSILNAYSQVNHALMLWSTVFIWSWMPAASVAAQQEAIIGNREAFPDDDAEDSADFVMGGLRFQPPLGVISAGLGDSSDED